MDEFGAADEQYLKAFDEAAGGALDLVVADLVTAGLTTDEASTAVAEELEYQDRSAPGGLLALRVLDRLQTILNLTSAPDWPLCPHHRDQPHRLFLQPSLDRFDATWSCNYLERSVARVGELAASLNA